MIGRVSRTLLHLPRQQGYSNSAIAFFCLFDELSLTLVETNAMERSLEPAIVECEIAGSAVHIVPVSTAEMYFTAWELHVMHNSCCFKGKVRYYIMYFTL